MKAVSISQPWATLVMLGIRRFETRGWHTEHRGQLGIHAARHFAPGLLTLCHRQPVRELLAQAGTHWSELPRGALLGTVELAGCTRVEELPEITELDRALADFHPGHWALHLLAPDPWPRPVSAAGRGGLFEVSCAEGRDRPACSSV